MKTTSSAMLFFHVLPFTDQKTATVSGVPKGPDTPKTVASFLSVNSKSSKKSIIDRVVSPRWAMLFFDVLPFTDRKNDAASLGVFFACFSFMFYRLPTNRTS